MKRSTVFVWNAVWIAWCVFCFEECAAHAQEWKPCATVTSTVAPASYEPRTALERIYYATAVCWRERALDERARVRTATTTLEVAREVPPPAELSPSSSVPTWLIFVALGVAGAAAAGAGLLGFELGRH